MQRPGPHLSSLRAAISSAIQLIVRRRLDPFDAQLGFANFRS
jgi:hypothetical protein